ncbi:hypothetical protein MUN89_18040 [Halobacillus salinarum]|uniref:Uncharacterized protein n=1 Tax=Halobacillus salinarum TaxID=2932257 RepID=A0ABY4EH35_9BACI|nr:hypothetical protein [Halobacillus salinarum]UOQ43762.1 hypothetical protein MUN89_18040 [Halobacillus salinarum]
MGLTLEAKERLVSKLNKLLENPEKRSSTRMSNYGNKFHGEGKQTKNTLDQQYQLKDL